MQHIDCEDFPIQVRETCICSKSLKMIEQSLVRKEVSRGCGIGSMVLKVPTTL